MNLIITEFEKMQNKRYVYFIKLKNLSYPSSQQEKKTNVSCFVQIKVQQKLRYFILVQNLKGDNCKCYDTIQLYRTQRGIIGKYYKQLLLQQQQYILKKMQVQIVLSNFIFNLSISQQIIIVLIEFYIPIGDN
eukprot:EC097136.1.p3 GENE.EC097136.1~~EC097136.1.p3  ORF type:complete len:133 (-),score=1.63 EC097136.1:205-603(-)